MSFRLIVANLFNADMAILLLNRVETKPANDSQMILYSGVSVPTARRETLLFWTKTSNDTVFLIVALSRNMQVLSVYSFNQWQNWTKQMLLQIFLGKIENRYRFESNTSCHKTQKFRKNRAQHLPTEQPNKYKAQHLPSNQMKLLVSGKQ